MSIRDGQLIDMICHYLNIKLEIHLCYANSQNKWCSFGIIRWCNWYNEQYIEITKRVWLKQISCNNFPFLGWILRICWWLLGDTVTKRHIWREWPQIRKKKTIGITFHFCWKIYSFDMIILVDYYFSQLFSSKEFDISAFLFCHTLLLITTKWMRPGWSFHY